MIKEAYKLIEVIAMDAINSKKQAAIPDLVRAELQKIEQNAQVILFGSQARQDNRSDSDWDFLILLEQEPTTDLKDEIRKRLYEIELETNEVISSIIHQKKEWEKRAVMPIHQIIEEEGVEL
jgi:predicted nucleotidyltransferase